MILRFDSNTVGKNKSVKEIIHGACIRIFHRTGSKIIFFGPTNIEPNPKPITNIKVDFSATVAKLKDFFRQTLIRSGTQVKIYSTFIMVGTTELILHRSMENTLKAINLWLDSELILAMRHVTIS